MRRGGPSVWTRAGRLAERPGAVDPREVAALALDLGILPAELIAEAEALADRCAAAGATTLPAMAAVAAAESGLDPALVRAEAERLLGGGR